MHHVARRVRVDPQEARAVDAPGEDEMPTQPGAARHERGETHPDLQRDTGLLRQHRHRPKAGDRRQHTVEGRPHRRRRPREVPVEVTERSTGVGLVAVGEQQVGDDRVPGLVALVARGHQVHVEALGTLAIGGAPVSRDSLFRIASTTKPITAAATLALTGEGLLRLDEPVDRLLPELAGRRVLRRMDGPLDDTVPAARPITARDLLTFTFGFGMVMEMFASPDPWPVIAAAGKLHLAALGPPDPGGQPDPDTWVAGLGSLPLLAQPGERWMYNTGASVLGVLLARAAGQPFGEVLRTRIFEPLGMTQTAFWASDPDRLAAAYRPSADGLERWDAPDGLYSRPPG